MLETATGPNYIKNCTAIDNGKAGLEVTYASRETYVDSCTIMDNKGANIGVQCQFSDDTARIPNTLCCEIKNSRIVSTGGEALILLGNWNNWILANKLFRSRLWHRYRGRVKQNRRRTPAACRRETSAISLFTRRMADDGNGPRFLRPFYVE